MPTGYTADIAKGITFEQFAMNCARAFGALVTMRDDPQNAPIPDVIEPSDYSQKRLEQTHVEMDRLLALSARQIADEAEQDFREELRRHAERMQKAAELRMKYEAMLACVRAWDAPTPDHNEFKAFMESQIVQSIDFDCDTSYDEMPQPKAPAVWIAERLAQLRKDVAYHENAHREEVERAGQRTAWIQALRNSLK
jgi:hypothetical protein